MGFGSFQNGRFDLTVSLRSASTEQPGFRLVRLWVRSLRAASQLLYDATAGQTAIRRVFVAVDYGASRAADAFLRPSNGTSSSGMLRRGSPGMHMSIMGDERTKPHVLVHEFGHYAFGLDDEYADGPPLCSSRPETQACIMAHGWASGDQIDATTGEVVAGVIRAFCGPENHDRRAVHPQNATHDGLSCWEVMVGCFPSLSIPLGFARPRPLAKPPRPKIVRVEPRGLHVLALPDGADEAARSAFAVAADYWRLICRESEHDVEVVSGGSEAEVLSASLGRFGANRRCSQVVVLFAPSGREVGEVSRVTARQCDALAVQIHPIAVGSGTDLGPLLGLADATSGRLENVEAREHGDQRHWVAQVRAMELAGELVDRMGLALSEAGTLPEAVPAAWTLPKKPAALTKSGRESLARELDRRRISRLGHGHLRDHPVYVEGKCAAAFFTLASARSDSKLTAFLVRPSGRVVRVGDPGVTLHERSSGHTTWVVRQPDRGLWALRVVRWRGGAKARYRVWVLADHAAVSLGMHGANHSYRRGEDIELRVHMACDWETAAQWPEGASARITPEDGGPPAQAMPYEDSGEPEGSPFRRHGYGGGGSGATFAINLNADWRGSRAFRVDLVDPGRPDSGGRRKHARVRVARFQLHVRPD
ncbi:MAG: hypothetical protein AAF628_23400 [Planctomycetota bacterium]